ncbi:BTAD domain-containing putative transcriptional regulator [Streptomyces sp. NPDC006367]|uniref:AfsR/SARP family transcriptional regulator n=1 Tax=unclassified Streptomyces TaxID=2593676 RepID=UPI0033A09726
MLHAMPGDARWEFRILGPLEVRLDGQVWEVSAPRLRSVLGALLLRADEVVPVSYLVDSVWEADPPADPPGQIATCVSQLRRKFEQAGAGQDLILTQRPGYRLSTERVRLDTLDFHSLREEARRCDEDGDPRRALSRLKTALSLWRGPVLSGIPCRAWQPAVRRWEEEHIAARETCSDIQLSLGLYEDLVTELSGFVQQYPLLERPRAQLMRGLFRSGRQSDALQLYHDTADLLREELAVQPGKELRDLHKRMLQGDDPGAEHGPEAAALIPWHRPESPSRMTPTRHEHAPGPRTARAGTPCQLPGDLAEFVGREDEIGTMTEWLVPGQDTAPVAVVVGPGGTGKTALAVHVAHRLRSVFTDGQLYVDLHGTDSHPVTAEETLARFLRELGLSGASIPSSLDECAVLFRTLLADRHMLLVMDNAGDADQIVPLLPGTGSCGVVITSRARLTTVPNTRVLELGVFGQQQAYALLNRLVGEERLSAEHAVAAQLIEYCGRLPLAVRIVAAKLASRPHWTLRKAASRLADERRRLDELTHENLEVRSSLELSHQGLSLAARTLLRRLSLLATSDFSDWICAPLMDLPLHDAEDALEELLDARLIDVISPAASPQPRYRLHDLVRLFALERLAEAEPQAEQAAAVYRSAATTLAMASLAHRTVCGGDFTVVHSSTHEWPASIDVVEHMASDPMRWYESDRATITALCLQTAEWGEDELAWDLAATSRCLFSVRFHFDDWRLTHESALKVVRRQGNRRGEAALLLGLGDLYLTKRRYDRAIPLLEKSCQLFQEVGDRHGYALALRKAACADRIGGRIELALARWQECLPVLEEFGDLEAQAQVLRWTAQTQLELGRKQQAETYLRAAEVIVASFSSRSAAQVRFSLAEMDLARGELDRAAHGYAESLVAATTLGDLSGRCVALLGLGTVDVRRGALKEGERRLGQALSLARDIQDPLLESEVLLALARAHQAAGDGDGAAALLNEGAELCRLMGAPTRHETFLRARAALGAQPVDSAGSRVL